MNARTVDERVVEMRFDNKQFEAGAKETMNTLEKLKKSLDMTDQSKTFDTLDKAANNVNLSGITSAVEALQNRFSTFGIIGMRVIENITDAIYNKLTGAVSFVTDSIVSGGMKRAMNIENAHFQLQALLKDEEKVQEYMDAANKSVTGTAYAYDEAAKAASMFAASGVKAGEEVDTALSALVGVAAMTNSDYEGISRIFTTIAGNGRLMGDQLLQLSSRGMNAAATIADYFREVDNLANITEADVREMVSDGMISFDIFTKAMNWAFGESAQRANETFTGAFANMKSALARIGAGFFSPLIEQNSEVVKLFNSLRIQIDNVKSSLVFDEQKSAISGLSKASGIATTNLKEMFSAMSETGKVDLSSLEELSEKGIDATSTLTKYINDVVHGTQRASYATTSSLKELAKETLLADDTVRSLAEGGMVDLDELIKTYSLSTDAIKKYVEEGRIDLAAFTSAMEREFGDQRNLSKQFTDTVLNVVESVNNFVNNLDLTKPLELFYYGVESVKNLAGGLYSIVEPLVAALDRSFSFSFDDILVLAQSIEEFTSKARLSSEHAENLYTLFKGLLSVVKLLGNGVIALLKAFSPLKDPLKSASNYIFDLAGNLGRLLSNFSEWVTTSPRVAKTYEILKSAIAGAVTVITNLVVRVREFIKETKELPGVKKFTTTISTAFKSAKDKIDPYIDTILNKLQEFVSFSSGSFSESFSSFLDNLAEKISKLDISKPLDSIKEIIQGFINWIKNIGKTKEPKGLFDFSENIKDGLDEANKSFDVQNFIDNLNALKIGIGSIIDWFKKNVDAKGIAVIIIGIGSAIAKVNKSIADAKYVSSMAGFVNRANELMKLIPTVSTSIKNFFGTLISVTRDLAKETKKNLKIERFKTLAIAIAILAGALLLLSFSNPGKMILSAVVLSAVVGVLYFVFNKLDKMKNLDDVGKVVSSLMIPLAIIAVMLFALAKRPWKQLAAATGGMVIVLWSLVGVSKALNKIGTVNKRIIKNFVLLSSVINIIGLSLKLAAKNNWLDLLFASIAISLTLAALTTVFYVLSKIDKKSINLKKIGLFVAGSLALIPIAIALSIVAAMPWARTLEAAAAISILLGVYAGVFALVSLVKPNLGSIALFVLGTAAIAGIAFSLLVLSVGDMTSVMNAAKAISLVLGVLAGAMLIATLAGMAAGPALLGMLLLDAFIVDFALILYGLGKLCQDSTVQYLIETGSEVLAKIGTAIGEFVGNIIGGALGAISNSFPIIGENLSLFMEKFQGFLDGVKQIDQESIDGVNAMIGMVLALTAASFLDSVTSFLTFGKGGLSGFGEKLAEFGKGFAGYCEAIANVDVDMNAVKASAEAARALGEMVSYLPSEGGFLDKIIGTKSLKDFGEQLAEFAQPLMDFANTTSGLTSDDVQGAIEAAKLLTELSKSLEGHDGLVQWIFGDKNLKDFAEELNKFAPAIVEFAAQVKDVTPEMVEGAANAATLMANMASELPNTGGWIDKIFGDKSLSEFAMELIIFGPRLRRFATEVAGIDSSSVEGALYAAQIMAEVAEALPEQGGWVDKIFGTKSLSDFGDELGPFGRAMRIFANTVSTVKVGAADGVVDVMSKLIAALEPLDDSGGILDIWFGSSDIGTFGEGLKTFGEAFGTFYGNISEIDTEQLTSVVDEMLRLADLAKLTEDIDMSGLEDFGDTLGKLGQTGVDKLIGAFVNSIERITTTLQTICTSMILTVTLGLPAAVFYNIGSETINSIINGENSKLSAILTTVKNLCDSVVAKFKSGLSPSKAIEIGKNFAIGLKDGIVSKVQEIANAAIDAAKSVIEKTKNVLGIASPSKVAYEIGAYWGIGIANGITSENRAIEKSAAGISQSVIDTTNELIKLILKTLDDDADYSPTITPVLDLSNLETASSQISSYFKDGFAVGTYNRASTVSASMNYAKKEKESSEEESLGNNKRFRDFLNRLDGEKFGTKIENTFNITSNNPEEVAEAVSRRIQRQVERKSSVWG